MTAEIKIGSSYGFDHNWTLVLTTPKVQKSFYLGQDVKFCTRVLGADPSYIVKKIGTGIIDEGTRGNKRLAKYICEQLKITGHSMKKLEAWSLCAE
jgi:hypothetical protein